MGIHTLGKTDIPTSTVNWFEIVKKCKHPVPFDVANLMFNVQWCYALECHEGDFTNALAKLKQFFSFFVNSDVNLMYVLDGKGNPHKAPEDLRRRQKRAAAEALLAEATNEDDGGAPTAEKYHALRGCVSNTSLFIALVYRLLKSMDLPVIVAHDEADGQLAALAMQRDGVALSFDSDLLAHGVEVLLRVEGGGGWWNGKATQLCVRSAPVYLPASDGQSLSPCGLAGLFRKHGKSAFVYFAVATGCDYSREASGIPGIGYKTACRLLAILETLTPAAFAGCIREHIGWIPSMSKEFKEEVLTVGQDGKDRLLDEYILPIVKAYSDSLFYDDKFNICRVHTRDLVQCFSAETKKHAQALLDPKTGEEFAEESISLIDGFSPHTVGKSAAHLNKEHVSKSRIPEDFSTMTVEQLRKILAARGAKTTHNKAELLKYVAAMKAMEEEYDPVVIDTSNGLMLPNLSYRSDLKPQAEIAKLLLDHEIKAKAKDVFNLLKLVNDMYERGEVLESVDEISIKTAILDCQFPRFYYSLLGSYQQEENKKMLRDSRNKSLEQITDAGAPVRYHGYAIVSETVHLLITTQGASMKTDERSRAKKEKGQKPHRQHYLSILELKVKPTSKEAGDEHDFGIVEEVLRKFCACKAGGGKCVHDGMALRDLIRVFAPNFVHDEVVTSIAKQWKNRGGDKERVFDPMKAIRHMSFEKKRTRDEKTNNKAYRACRHNSKQLHYDVLSPDDMALFEEKCNPSILFSVYDTIKRNRADERPARAALLYQEGSTETGLVDVRPSVELWGSNSQIAASKETTTALNSSPV
jgi:5'-3' exonuclease